MVCNRATDRNATNVYPGGEADVVDQGKNVGGAKVEEGEEGLDVQDRVRKRNKIKLWLAKKWQNFKAKPC